MIFILQHVSKYQTVGSTETENEIDELKKNKK